MISRSPNIKTMYSNTLASTTAAVAAAIEREPAEHPRLTEALRLLSMARSAGPSGLTEVRKAMSELEALLIEDDVLRREAKRITPHIVKDGAR